MGLRKRKGKKWTNNGVLNGKLIGYRDAMKRNSFLWSLMPYALSQALHRATLIRYAQHTLQYLVYRE